MKTYNFHLPLRPQEILFWLRAPLEIQPVYRPFSKYPVNTESVATIANLMHSPG